MFIVFIRSLILYVLIMAAIRVMGKRQIGQLQPFELVITLLLSELVAIPMQNTGIPLVYGIIPVLLLIACEIAVSVLSIKSRKFKHLMIGKPIFIIENGKLNQKDLVELRLCMSDLLEELRQNNIFNISDVMHAIIETNGKLSVYKKNDTTTFQVPLIIDGQLVSKDLRKTGYTQEQIEKTLADEGYAGISDMLFFAVDDAGNKTFINKEA